jgi:hypothetical protein
VPSNNKMLNIEGLCLQSSSREPDTLHVNTVRHCSIVEQTNALCFLKPGSYRAQQMSSCFNLIHEEF